MSWQQVKLKSILKQYRNEIIVKDDVSYGQITVSKYDGVCFRGNKIGLDIGRKRQFKVDLMQHPNTLIFVRQGVAEGAIGIAPLNVDGCIATENMPMFSVEGINVDFLKLYIQSPAFLSKLQKLSTTGTAQKSLHERQILELNIFIPIIEKQKEIVTKYIEIRNQIDKLFHEINLQKKYLAKLKQSILQDAICGKLTEDWREANPNIEPASELLKRIKAEKQRQIKEGKIRKEKPLDPITDTDLPFTIPPTWQWCRLGDLCYIASGSTPSAEKFCNHGIPYLKMYNMRNQKIDFHYKPQYVSAETHNTSLKRSRTNIGDVLMNIVGPPLGKLALVPEVLPEANFNQAMVLIRSSDLDINKWIYWFLNEKSEINSIVTKGVAGQDNISTTQTKNLKVAFPPQQEQKRIIDIIKNSLEKCSLIEAQITANEQTAQNLIKSILSETFNNN